MATSAHPAFGDLLRRHRLAAELTQEQLADRAGLSWRGISDLERGLRRVPQRETLRLLGDALELGPLQRAEFETAARRPPAPAAIEVATARPGSDLPVPPTALIGRERELASIRALLRRGDVRLITLSGPPGTGKTRLAVAAAVELAQDFADGVYFVPLASLSDVGLLPATIALTLGVAESAGQSASESLKSFLSQKQALLVLDNFEHLLAAAPAVADLQAACPRLMVMVTSRSVLHLTGEHNFAVPPLQLPDPAKTQSAEELLGYEALRLFVDRARATAGDGACPDDMAPVVAEICRRLDGLPLAIELAAARVRLLPLPAILARLDSRLRLLTQGARDLPQRQRSLRATIEWSYDLLEDTEKLLFRRLSVFVGGTSLEAIEAICDAEHDLGLGVLEGVAVLVDRGMLMRGESAGGEPGFGMLQTLREFALELLTAGGEADLLRERHAEYFLAVAEAAEPMVRSGQQRAYLASLKASHDDLRAALTWCSRRGQASPLLRLVAALWRYWLLQGDFSEGRRWLDQALALVDGSEDPRLRARALHGAGVLAWSQADAPAARAQLEQSLALWQSIGDPTGQGEALTELGMATWREGDVSKARAIFEASIELLRLAGDRWSLAQALHNVGHVYMDSSDYLRARAVWEESMALFRATGDSSRVAVTLGDIGLVSVRSGDYATARPLYEECLALLREVGDRWQMADTLDRLGELALFEGRPNEAATCYQESLALSTEVGNRAGMVESLNLWAEASALQGDFARANNLYSEGLQLARETGSERLVAALLHNLGYLALAEGDAGRATALFRESLAHHEALGRAPGIAFCLAGLAEAAAGLGAPERAACLFGAAEALRELAGATMDPFRPHRAHAGPG